MKYLRIFAFVLGMALLFGCFGDDDDDDDNNDYNPNPTPTVSITWAPKAGAVTAFRVDKRRADHTMVVYNGKAYAFGGIDDVGVYHNDVFAYDFATDSWAPLVPVGGLPVARKDHTAIIYNNRMWIFGGQNSVGNTLQDIWSYSFLSNSWTNEGNAPIFRQNHVSVYGNNRMYTVGGRNQAGTLTIEVWQYDFAGTWVNLNPFGFPLPPAVENHAGAFFNNKIFIMGGRDQMGNLDNQIWMLDLSLNEWFMRTRIFQSREQHTCTIPIHADGKIFVFGGIFQSGEQCNDTWMYITQYRGSSEWVYRAEDINIFRNPFPRDRHAAVIYNDRMYVYGGNDMWSGITNELWEGTFVHTP